MAKIEKPSHMACSASAPQVLKGRIHSVFTCTAP